MRWALHASGPASWIRSRPLTGEAGSRKLLGGRADAQPRAPRVSHAPKWPPASRTHPGLHGLEVGPPPTTRTPRAGAGSPDSLLQWGPWPAGAGRVGHSRFAPIRDSMRSRRLWRSRWTMKSSSERTRKDDTQLTTRRIPLAMESSRLPPSAGGRAGLRGPAPPPPQRPSHWAEQDRAGCSAQQASVPGWELRSAGPCQRPSLGLAAELCPPCTSPHTEARLTRSLRLIRGSGRAPWT